MVVSWKPKYQITDRLIFTIREIGEAMGEIKSFNLAGKALAKLDLEARELSTFISTTFRATS